MDILFELSYLFNQDAQSLGNKDKEYKDLKSIEGQLLEQIPEDLRGKLIDVQTEISYHKDRKSVV